MAGNAVSVAVAAQNNWSNAIDVYGAYLVDLSISGLNGHTVTVQRKLFKESTWRDVGTFTQDAVLQNGAPCQMRVGVATGDFGTGTVTCRLEAGRAL